MATLQIIKNTAGYFRFVLDGDEAKSVIDNAPNATSFENKFHFKTKNGAPIFAKQNILFSEITYTDIADTDFTFASVHEVWVKLIDEEFFKGLNASSGSGATRFDGLLDTFTFPGNNGKVPVVNSAELKLDPVEFYNYKDFIQLQDVSIPDLIEGKMITTALVLGVPKLVLSDLPSTTEQLVNAVGFFDYADLATQTTPVTLIADTDTLLPNDTLGVSTNTSNRPFGVSSIIDSSTGAFNFSQLTIGDTIDIRFDITVTTTSANQRVKSFLRLAVGTVAEYDLLFLDSIYKTAGTYQIVRYFSIYIGAEEFRDYPSEFYVNTDSSGTCVVNGWFSRVIRKGVNIVDFSIEEDNTADHYLGTWNASTNSPSLANGFGQVGDQYKVSVSGAHDFGSGSISFGLHDIVSFDGSVWYKKVDNNQTAVLTSTIKSITSKDLTLQNTTGLVAYINALNPVLIVGGNEEVFYLVTDSGQLFKLLLRDRPFGVGQPAITEGDLQQMFVDTSITERSWSQWCAPGTGGTIINVTGGGNPLAITGTAGVVSMNLDTKINSIPFIKATGSSGTNQSCGWKETSNYNTSLIQGFDYVFIYAPEDNTAGSRGFVGLYGSTAALSAITDPSSFGQYNVGLGHDAADTNLYIMHNDHLGSSTKVALGANFPANDNTKAYLLRLTSYPVSNSANAVVYWKVVELVSGNVSSGVITTDLPRNSVSGTSVLTHVIWRNTAGNSTVPVVKISKIFMKRLN